MPHPRCGRCGKRGTLQATVTGPRCKHCADRLSAALRRDPTRPRPNADSRHRPSKRAGVGATRP
jgi:hypothetical protein